MLNTPSQQGKRELERLSQHCLTPWLMQSRAVGPCKSWHLAVGSRSQLLSARDRLMPSCCVPIMYHPHSRLSGWRCTRLALDPADPEQLLLTPTSLIMCFPFFWFLLHQTPCGQHCVCACGSSLPSSHGLRSIQQGAGTGYFLGTCHVFPKRIVPADTTVKCGTACCSLPL